MTAAKILAIAKAELGTAEQPANSNKVKYNTAYYGREVSGASYPWCCAFVWWVFQQAGAAKLFYGGGKTAYCPTLLSFFKKKGQLVSSAYKPGDIVFFNFSGGTGASHVGICTGWDGTNITTIDGNTGSGNEANGGAVMERKRHKRYIVGVARPAYSGGGEKLVTIQLPILRKGSSGDSVTAMQQLLTAKGYSTQGIDGAFGTNTDKALRKFQKANGLSVDGICGEESWSALLGI